MFAELIVEYLWRELVTFLPRVQKVQTQVSGFLPTAYRLLPSANRLPPTANCRLPTSDRLLLCAYCPPYFTQMGLDHAKLRSSCIART